MSFWLKGKQMGDLVYLQCPCVCNEHCLKLNFIPGLFPRTSYQASWNTEFHIRKINWDNRGHLGSSACIASGLSPILTPPKDTSQHML